MFACKELREFNLFLNMLLSNRILLFMSLSVNEFFRILSNSAEKFNAYG